MTNKYLTKFTKVVGNLSFFAFLGSFLIFIACYLYVGPQLPAVKTLKDIRLQTPMSVFTADNHLLATFGEKRRIPVAYEDIPEKLNQALIATEDKRFFSHGGVDAMGFARSVFQILSTGRKGGGGSTITMQLARNFFLTFDTTFIRKTKEIFLAWKIERALTKEEILTLYWNKIDFSNRAHGVGAAAQVYYGTTVDKLTLPQLAILAGIPKGPTTHNPLANPEKALNRRNHVLKRMQIEEYIDEQALNEALETPLSATYHGSRVTVRAPYLAEMVRREMISQFGKDKAYTSGFKVYTTLISELQKVSRKSLRESLISYDRRHGYRGAERHFNEIEQLLLTLNLNNLIEDTDDAEPLVLQIAPQIDLESLESLPSNTKPLDTILNDIPVLGDLQPAMVLSLSEKTVQILLKKTDRHTPLKDRLVTIQWQGLSWARPFINESRRGSRPRTASAIVKVGDLIRTYKDQQGNWQLTQLPEVSAAFVALKPQDGAIVSLVGGFDYDFSKFNNVVQARRQPGSIIKPFIYSAALEKGYTAASVVNDAPFTRVDVSSENIWRPKNSSGKYKGPTRLRNALKSSTNLVSIRLLDDISPQYAVDYLSNLGFDRTRMPAVNSLALGAADFTPLEVATGFAIFANGGYRVDSYFINRIEDSNGNVIFEEQPLMICEKCNELLAHKNSLIEQQKAEQASSKAEQILLEELSQEQDSVLSSDINNSPSTADEVESNSQQPVQHLVQLNEQIRFVEDLHQDLTLIPELPIEEDKIAQNVITEDNVFIINSMLQDVIHRGTASAVLRRSKSPLLKRRDLAGKTGTTNEAKDAWFSGYNGDFVATAWVGYSDYSRGLGIREFGGIAALPIWQGFMEKALDGVPTNTMKQPAGLVTAKIDPVTGLLAPAGMEGAIFEIFRQRFMPTEFASTSQTDPFNEENNEVEDEETIF